MGPNSSLPLGTSSTSLRSRSPSRRLPIASAKILGTGGLGRVGSTGPLRFYRRSDRSSAPVTDSYGCLVGTSAQMRRAKIVRTLGSRLGVWDKRGVERRESSQMGIFVRRFGTTTDGIIPSLPLLLSPPISISAARRNARPAPPVPPVPLRRGKVFLSPVVSTQVTLPRPVQDAPEALLGSNIIDAAVYPNCAAAAAAMDAIPACQPQTDQLI